MLEKPPNPHDSYARQQLYKKLVAKDLLQNTLPQQISSKVHWDSLCLAPAEFVQKTLKNQRSDIL